VRNEHRNDQSTTASHDGHRQRTPERPFARRGPRARTNFIARPAMPLHDGNVKLYVAVPQPRTPHITCESEIKTL
jgi:hypothetical protein